MIKYFRLREEEKLGVPQINLVGAKKNLGGARKNSRGRKNFPGGAENKFGALRASKNLAPPGQVSVSVPARGWRFNVEGIGEVG